MIRTILIKPLSVNAAFQGRRFKTKECNAYCKEVALALIPYTEQYKGLVEVRYYFYLKNWKKTDGDNLVKVLQDCIVKRGMIEDDSKIMRYVIEKIPSGIDSINFEILEYKKSI